MKAGNLLNVGLMGAMVLVVGIVWKETQTRRAIRAALGELERKSAITRAEERRVTQQSATLETERSRQQSLLEEQTRKSAGNAAPASNPPRRITYPARPWIPERLQKEPEFQVLWLADHRAALSTRYGPFFHQLGLTPAQVERVQALMLKRDEQEMDLQATARTQELAKDDPTLKRLRGQIAADYAASVKEALGETGSLQLRDYERSASVQDIMAGLAGGAAVVAREPFTAFQAAQLSQSIANASARYREGGPAITNEIDWDRVEVEARKFLTPSQLAFMQRAEPPLPVGGRFQSQLYGTVERAKKSEATPATKPPGD